MYDIAGIFLTSNRTQTLLQENGSATTLPMERLSYERLRTNGIYYLREYLEKGTRWM